MFEIDPEVVLLFHWQVKPQGWVMIKTNPCNRWTMSQVQSRHETLHENLVELTQKSTVHEDESHQ